LNLLGDDDDDDMSPPDMNEGGSSRRESLNSVPKVIRRATLTGEETEKVFIRPSFDFSSFDNRERSGYERHYFNDNLDLLYLRGVIFDLSQLILGHLIAAQFQNHVKAL
jgi:hypothetical protein